MMGQRTEPDPLSQDRKQYGLDLSEQRHEPASSRRAVRLYVATLLLFPFLLLAGSLIWMSTAEYQRHAQYPSFVGLGYGLRLRGANCDVVVDGDSSALTGVLPAAIEQRTGLKTCNIAEVAGVKYINGMAELNEYLAHNRPPRYLVLMFVPENLNSPQNWIEVAHFEGWFYGLRFRRDAALFHRALALPEDFLTSAELGLRTGLQWLPYPELPPALGQVREHNGGRMPEPGAVPMACAPPLAMRTPDPQWLHSLRDSYATTKTRVLIDVTPEPACDPSFAFYAARTGAGVTDNSLATLPFNDYSNTGRLHASDAGAQIISERIGKQIAALQGNGAAQNVEVR